MCCENLDIQTELHIILSNISYVDLKKNREFPGNRKITVSTIYGTAVQLF